MYVLSIYKGNDEIREEPITPLRAVSIGRNNLNDICLPDDQDISRFHAALFRDEEGNYYLQDLGSKNGTKVNNKRKDFGALYEEDEIKIGSFTLILRKQADKSQLKKAKVDLTYKGPDEDAKTTFSAFSSQLKEAAQFKEDAEGLFLLYNLNHLAKVNPDIEEVLQLITKELFNTFQPDRIIIALIEQQRAGLTCLARFPQEDTRMEVSRTMIQYLLNEKKTLVTNDAPLDIRLKKAGGETAPSILKLGVKSAICAPLQWDGEIKGILYMDCSRKTKIFTERDVNLISLIAEDISSFIERDSHYTSIENEKNRFENLVEIGNTIIGINRKIKEVLTNIKKFSAIDATVLITGETGTGKDLAAEVIHNTSKRKGKPFIPINCAAIPQNLFEALLFGVIPDFPGFQRNQGLKGKFELADGGTIFLNEIGDLSLESQARLLDVLGKQDEGKKLIEIWPLGANKPTLVDVRIMAATNKDLKLEKDKGNFREDLYQRLNILSFQMPSLRERKEDIPLLASYFLYRFRQENEKKISRLSNSCIEYLTSYEWPGNIRELKNAILKAVILTESAIINKDLFALKEDWKPTSLDEAEKEHIMKVLEYTRGNKEKACRILGISKQTIHNKGKKYGLPGFEGQSTLP